MYHESIFDGATSFVEEVNKGLEPAVEMAALPISTE
jgi:hypothetical protein